MAHKVEEEIIVVDDDMQHEFAQRGQPFRGAKVTSTSVLFHEAEENVPTRIKQVPDVEMKARHGRSGVRQRISL